MKKAQIPQALIWAVLIGIVIIISITWFWPGIKGISDSLFGTSEELIDTSTSSAGNWVYHEGDTAVITESLSDVPAPPAAPPTGDCKKLPASYWAGFLTYEEKIKSAVAASSMPSALAGTGYIPEALLAATLSYESNWNPKAVGGCGDGGIAQFQAGTANDMGLTWDYIGTYGRHTCSITINGVKKDVGCLACSTCNPGYKSVCDLTNDPRFNADKAIPAAARYLGIRLNDCKSKLSSDKKYVSVGVSSYNTGNCIQINTVYIGKVVTTYYPMFAACLAERGYKAQ